MAAPAEVLNENTRSAAAPSSGGQPGNEARGRQAVRGELGGKQIVVTPSGQVLVGDQRVVGFSGVEDILGMTDDERSGQQIDATIGMAGRVLKLMIWADPDLIMKIKSGEETLENVLDKAGKILDKMAATQLAYEERRLRVGQLDSAQAALESVSALARSTNFLDWMKAPSEIKEIAKLVLGDARRANAIVLAASIDPDQMKRGLANFNQMVDAAARADLEQRLVEFRAQDQRNAMNEESFDRSERGRLVREKLGRENVAISRQAALDLAASALSRSGQGIVDLADGAAEKILDRVDDATEKFANRFIGEDGILRVFFDGLASAVEKGKEPHLIGFFGGGVFGLIEGTALATLVVAGGPVTWVPVAVVVGSGLTGGLLGARSPEFLTWFQGRLMGTKLGKFLGVSGGGAVARPSGGVVTSPPPVTERPGSSSVGTMPSRPTGGLPGATRPSVVAATRPLGGVPPMTRPTAMRLEEEEKDGE